MSTDTTLVFGHKSPDTDSTGSAIIWAWFLSHHGGAAEARLLGTPNTEAQFVAERWGFDLPPLLDGGGGRPEGRHRRHQQPRRAARLDRQGRHPAIIDHHKLSGLETKTPVEITIRPVACTATLLWQLMGGHAGHAPDGIKGLALSCILSDTLEFRSPTTTPVDRRLAEILAQDLGIDIPSYAAEMFAAKSDVSRFSDAELLRMDSKEYTVDGTDFRVSVLETTSPETILSRKASLMESMKAVAAEDGADQVLLFVIDILKEEATLLVPNDLTRRVAEASFGATATGDTVVLPASCRARSRSSRR